MVQFNHVTKIYDNKLVAVDDLDFTLEQGEFVFLIGPSGSGKTTIIKMLIRDEVPTTGKIFFNDKDITKVNRKQVYTLRREIGVIFQDYKLVQDKTAFENVSFAMEAAGKSDKDIKETVPYVLDIVGLSNRMGAFPRQLSGGEQQRVAIARAIANNPKILIADEPTGNLDPASSWDIVQILSKINNWGTTVIMSTHGTDIVNALNKRVIQMDKGRVSRDDNKGSYEMIENYSEKMLDKEKKEKKENQSKAKKKSTFRVKIPKAEGHTENEDDGDLESGKLESGEEEGKKNEKRGFFSKLFGKKQKQSAVIKKEDKSIMGAFTEDEEEEESEKIESGKVGKLESRELESGKVEKSESGDEELESEKVEKSESGDEELESGTVEKSESGKEELESGEKEKKNVETDDQQSSESKPNLHMSLSAGLAQKIDNEKSDTKKETESKDDVQVSKDIKLTSKKVKEIVENKDKTLVTKLNLDKKILKDLKTAGFEYVEEIIEKGPEGLTDSLVIDPEEIILISKEIKKFIENKQLFV